MFAATGSRASKTKGPSDGPFAALWLLLRELMRSWRKPGGRHGFEDAFAILEEKMKATLLSEAIKAYNADNPDFALDPKDFEIRAVKRGRGCVYDIFARSGRTLGDEIAFREAEALRESERAFFNFRRMAAQHRRWTWLRKRVRGKLTNAYVRIGRFGRARLSRRLRAASLSGVGAIALAASSRAPP